MEWPKLKESPKGKSCTCEARYDGECGCGADWSDNDGYNAAIKACKAAYAKEDRLVALDEFKLTEFLIPTYPDDSIDNVYEREATIAIRKYNKVKNIANGICSKFGSPAIPTEDDIRSMLDGFNVNKSMEISRFIYRRLLESKT